MQPQQASAMLLNKLQHSQMLSHAELLQLLTDFGAAQAAAVPACRTDFAAADGPAAAEKFSTNVSRMTISNLPATMYQSALDQQLFTAARKTAAATFKQQIYTRALIEFSSYCRNDCYYCGLRHSNAQAVRRRLTTTDIMTCCSNAYRLGMRTFVLQSGEDLWFSETDLCNLIRTIKAAFPACAVTLSIGERPPDAYAAFFAAGADRFLLRQETADTRHYQQLHPPGLTAEQRQQSLRALKCCGFQVGSGFMVGSPGQTAAHLAADLAYLQHLQPQMIGIGPFIPHQDTPFAAYPAGSVQLSLRLLALLRLLFPQALLPATTALGTLDPLGIEKAILAGANVIMPNVTPAAQKEAYHLYNKKNDSSTESQAALARLQHNLQLLGYQLTVERGDHPYWSPTERKMQI